MRERRHRFDPATPEPGGLTRLINAQGDPFLPAEALPVRAVSENRFLSAAFPASSPARREPEPWRALPARLAPRPSAAMLP